jgi:AcrR family transcriptional regulator
MEPAKSYHHGDLHPALLSAAEAILCRDGLPALTLRAVAREAGVSHGAPAHHFKDLSELLSELVAVGFERLAAAMQTACQDQPDKFAAVAEAYLAFAVGNPALFQLMFRVERLHAGHDRLRAARATAFATITEASGIPTEIPAALTPDQLGAITAKICLVQGLAGLAVNGRLAPLFHLAPPGTQPPDLLKLALAQLRPAG